jgi:membrane protease YdiL (CAAX protease family)
MNLTRPTYHLVIVSFYFLVCLYFFTTTQHIASYFTFNTVDFLVFLFSLLIISLLLLIINHLTKFRKIAYQKKSTRELLAIVVYATVLIAIPEEILFRGIIQGYLQSSLPEYQTLLVSSVVFGFAHFKNDSKGWIPQQWNWKLIFLTFTVGLFLGSLFIFTKSLVAPILLHAILLIGMKLTIQKSS